MCCRRTAVGLEETRSLKRKRHIGAYCPTNSFTTPRSPPAVPVARGQVIGINFAMVRDFGGSTFAIPVRFGESILKP